MSLTLPTEAGAAVTESRTVMTNPFVGLKVQQATDYVIFKLASFIIIICHLHCQQRQEQQLQNPEQS